MHMTPQDTSQGTFNDQQVAFFHWLSSLELSFPHMMVEIGLPPLLGTLSILYPPTSIFHIPRPGGMRGAIEYGQPLAG